MKVRHLNRPVTASKADWLPGTTYLGFTPKDASTNARASCQSTVQKQTQGGYILEYVTEKFDKPNPGFESDPRIVSERIAHDEVAGCLIALHRIRSSARALAEIVGQEEFDVLQDMWADRANRVRWSVAFPIVRTFRILGTPKAKTVFGDSEYRRVFAYSTSILRPLSDSHREAIADLEIEECDAPNAWIALEDEMEVAQASDVFAGTLNQITSDLRLNAFEGYDEERASKLRKRAAWLADKFWRRCVKSGQTTCEICKGDQAERAKESMVPLRSLMDVHHLDPLAEGSRWTTIDDFCLLCPTCHRWEHAMLRRGRSLLGSSGFQKISVQ